MSASRAPVRVVRPWLSLLLLACACGGSAGERGAAGNEALSGAQVAALTRRDSAMERADEKLSPPLRQQLAELAPGALLEVVVDLRDQVDPLRLAALVDTRPRSRRERRALAVEAARRVADAGQRRVRRTLDSLTALGVVSAHRGYTVMNRFIVEATPDVVRVLARHPDVSRIIPATVKEPEVPMYRRREHGRARDAQGELPPWALGAVGADSAWRLGLAGGGAVVGIIDAGASASHEQLRTGFRGGAASWYDPRGRSASPTDGPQGHGTGILSLAVGRAAGRYSIGVAPGAQWVACVGLPEGRYDAARVTECAEWIFATAQPDVLIAPWLIADASCDRSLEPIVNAWRAAEILPVFAAGNEGPAAGSGGSPANYADLYPGAAVATSVGGVGRDRRVYTRSSRGPNRCTGGVYPLLVAPAEDVTVAYPLSPTMYVRTAGTSYAAGLVAGAAALLFERHPEARVVEIEEALRAGARDVGFPGADHTFGFGALYIPGALAALDRIRAAAPARGLHDVPADR